jgi:release factor glutamine methyltransferase
MNSKQLFNDFVSRIKTSDRDEAIAIAYLVFRDLGQLSRTDILADKPVSHFPLQKLEEVINELNYGKPIQYILGREDFYGRSFIVNNAVLIPRPETEELVKQVISVVKANNWTKPKILDVGTGSGCIPITLALEIANSDVYATDISADALAVARKNASGLNASVQFFQHDILTEKLTISALDIITSNPPYIAASEKDLMNKNVLEFEPHLALFVSDQDPLIFYKALLSQAQATLKSGGLLIVEINERFGDEVKNLFDHEGFSNTIIIKDLSGKSRMVSGVKR